MSAVSTREGYGSLTQIDMGLTTNQNLIYRCNCGTSFSSILLSPYLKGEEYRAYTERAAEILYAIVNIKTSAVLAAQ